MYIGPYIAASFCKTSFTFKPGDCCKQHYYLKKMTLPPQAGYHRLWPAPSDSGPVDEPKMRAPAPRMECSSKPAFGSWFVGAFGDVGSTSTCRTEYAPEAEEPPRIDSVPSHLGSLPAASILLLP